MNNSTAKPMDFTGAQAVLVNTEAREDLQSIVRALELAGMPSGTLVVFLPVGESIQLLDEDAMREAGWVKSPAAQSVID